MLVLPSIQRRFENSRGFKIDLIQKMRRVLGIAELNKAPSKATATVGRCKACVHNIVGSPEYKEKRQKLNKKLKLICEKCSEFVCKNHIKEVCEICVQQGNV